ncbi:MAG: helix-turn-helix domain-containing protein [Balneolaceae bacterium]|nr:helix-turn-helix domain-containing protein [Balneolaceae bacterium]
MASNSDSTQSLYIKNMVCPRCEMAVRDTLEEAGLTVRHVELGKAVVQGLEKADWPSLEEKLHELGFELIEGKEQKSVEQIKTLLLDYVNELEKRESSPRISEYLSKKMHQNYASLSKLFSEQEETTIEKYLIHLKIERVKELLSYGELTLSEIAWRLNYSSVQYLSNQFRKITGMSVTDYKKAHDSFRRSIDEI